MNIRKAEAKDIDGIYDCFLELGKAEDQASRKVDNFLMDIRKRRKDFEKSAKKQLLKEIKQKNSLYLIAEKNKEIAGYIFGTIQPTKNPFFDLPRVGHFNALVVREKFRGQGIAMLLNKELEKWFRKNKCKLVYLEVFSENPASQLYLKWGYKITDYTMGKKL